MSHKPDSVALDVAKLDVREIRAIKSLAVGEASADQQMLALEVIVKKLSRAFDLGYLPGSFDESAFLNGRMFVGMQITKVVNQPMKDEK